MKRLIPSKKQVLFAASVAVLSMSLTACFGHSNPLKTASPKEAVRFLMAASVYAEKAQHIYQGSGGTYYEDCMNHKIKGKVCQGLYQSMVKYAKTTSDFKSLTVDDLTDQGVWSTLKSNYARTEFNSI